MMRFPTVLAPALAAVAATAAAPGQPTELVQRVRDELNSHATVAGTEESKSYRVLFDAYLEMEPTPREVGPDFGLRTIHPGMDGWSSIADWAETNHGMAEAILACKGRNIFGLPYGPDQVPATYRQAELMVHLGEGGTMRDIEFPYLDAIDVIAAFSTAEIYRRMEAGQVDPGLDLALAHLAVLRQLCDREFYQEKSRAIELLADALRNLRDVFALYQDKITRERFVQIAWWDIPFLRPDRNRLFIPEADHVVSKALIEEVFVARTGAADPTKFTSTFAGIQSADEPLTRFGAARRWTMISEIHGSLEASMERLQLVYDDWWRRWRVQEYDDILDIPTQFERTNKVRYAAVIYSMQDIESLFARRNELVAEVNGTAMAAGLCAYRRRFSEYPNDSEKVYAQFVRKSSDTDPFDKAFGAFLYRRPSARTPIDTGIGRLWVEAGQCILYSRGQDHEDQRAEDHTDDGLSGDLVLWPPIKATARAQGKMD
jgi:hypothetical protein